MIATSYTVQLPSNNFIGKDDITKRFTSGWALWGLTSFASGQPVQLEETDDRSLSGTFSDSIDGPNYANNGSPLYINRNPRTGQPYFNPAYFVPEPLGQVGNAMRRFFHGPGLDNYSMALLKSTEITEKTQLGFRAEAFNIFSIMRSSTIRQGTSTIPAPGASVA